MSGTVAFQKFVQYSSVILFRFSGYSETAPDGLEAFIVLVEVVGAVTHLEAHATALGSGPGAHCACGTGSGCPRSTGGRRACHPRGCCPSPTARRFLHASRRPHPR